MRKVILLSLPLVVALVLFNVNVFSMGKKAQDSQQDSRAIAEEKVLEETTAAMPAAEKVFSVYTDKNSSSNHYAASGWMGDYGDLKINDQYTDDYHAGTSSIQIVYSGSKTQGAGWAGIYWQNPPNNWGSRQGGFDLTGFNKLTVWLKGKNGGEVIDKLKVGGIKGTFSDTAEVEIGPVKLTDDWQAYTINLAGKDISYISGGFAFVLSSELNPNGATFYIDDISFEYDPMLKAESKQAEKMPFSVYSDKGAVDNHYVASGWMGDYGDITYDAGSTDSPYLGSTCIKIVYSGKATQGARWAGIYWQNPPNNWGTKDAGFDLSAATKLTFYARGEKGGERIEEFKIGGITGDFSDSDSAGIGPVILTREWQQYTIDLKGKDMSYIIGGFCWATNIDVNPDGAVFYLDEIKYE